MGDADKGTPDTASSFSGEKSNPDGVDKFVLARRAQRMKDRAIWDAWWKYQDLNSVGHWMARIRYRFQSFCDAPVTWFRERIVEPLQDQYKQPFYQMKFARCQLIDECGVRDQVKMAEANEQYRLDKLVEFCMQDILESRLNNCISYHKEREESMNKCAKIWEEMEENELNLFVKYGELGVYGDAITCYMKQKHRLIWERRHPEVMAERQRQIEEHKKLLAEGSFDHSFWKLGYIFQDKANHADLYPHTRNVPFPYAPSTPLSKDWEYYKRKATDPDFTPEEDLDKPMPAYLGGAI